MLTASSVVEALHFHGLRSRMSSLQQVVVLRERRAQQTLLATDGGVVVSFDEAQARGFDALPYVDFVGVTRPAAGQQESCQATVLLDTSSTRTRRV